MNLLKIKLNYFTMWINLKNEKPNYYHPVSCYVLKTNETYTCWLAVNDDGQYIWTQLNTDLIIRDITHWTTLPEEIVEKIYK